ncbi:MAG: hypothetical protein KA383_20410 [Phycisphaerae bacterium]|nr:hypothetical protein [Phycisphaerae bacterium]
MSMTAQIVSQSWTLVVAITGAVTGIISLLWNIRRDLADRPKVQVTASENFLLPYDGASEDDLARTYVVITAVNAGRRPVTINGFCFVQSDGQHAVLAPDFTTRSGMLCDRLPKELAEGQAAKCVMPSEIFDRAMVKKFFVGDTVGRHWYSAAFPLRVKTIAGAQQEAAAAKDNK